MIGKSRNWKHPLQTALLASALLSAPFGANAQVTSPFEISTINGTNGFTMSNILGHGNTGLQATESSVVGDFNGDGIDDIVLSRANLSPTLSEGIAVIFGSTTSPAPNYDGTFLDGTQGFILNGNLGKAGIAAGDFNGDGIDDLVIGHPTFDGNIGRLEILFGKTTGFVPFETHDLEIINTFGSGTGFGESIAVTDFDNDGYDDIITGIPGGATIRGAVVIFGDASFSVGMRSIGEAPGFATLLAPNSFGDNQVAAIGDFNNDGFGDVVTTFSGGSSSGLNFYFGTNDNAGSSGIKFPTFELDNSNVPISDVNAAGDFNGDGIDDVIIGSSASLNAFILFGETGSYLFNYSLRTGGSNPSLPGIEILGFNGSFGFEVAGVGDVNNDGFDDVAIGAPTTPAICGLDNGAAFVIYGTTSSFINLSGFSSSDGFIIQNTNPATGVFNLLGQTLAGGDFNNDGFSDVLVSATGNGSISLSNYAYVIFGDGASSSTTTPPVTDVTGPELTLDRLVTNTIPFSLTGTYTDPSGVRRVRARVRDNGLGVLPRESQVFSAPFETAGNFSIEFSPLSLADGVYDVELDARDNAINNGGTANNDSVVVFDDTFIFDTTPPIFQFAIGSMFSFGFTEKGGGPSFLPDNINELFPCAIVNESGEVGVFFEDISAISIVDLNEVLTASSPGITINGFSSVMDFGDDIVGVSLNVDFAAEGDYEIVFPAGTLSDEAGNTNPTSLSVCVVFDTTPPSLECENSFAPVGGSLHFNNEPIIFTLSFDEVVTDVSVNDFFVDTDNGFVRSVYPVGIPSDTFTIEVVPFGGPGFFLGSSTDSEKFIIPAPSFDFLVLGYDPEANDLAGNEIISSQVFAGVDLTPPFSALPDPALLISEDPASFDRFGRSVSISKAVVVAGAELAGENQEGVAYVFEAEGISGGPFQPFPFGNLEKGTVEEEDFFTTFTQQAVLTAPDGQRYDFFGTTVAAEGDWIAVGASHHDDPFSPTQLANIGAVYMYNRAGFRGDFPDIGLQSPEAKGLEVPFGWEFTQKIVSPNPRINAQFGKKVEIYGNIMAISEPYERRGGAVYIYVLDPCSQTWEFEQRLQADDISRNDDFGINFSLNGTSILIGSPRDDDRGNDTGSAYLYTRFNNIWLQQLKFVPGAASRGDKVGTGVDLTNLLAAIGAPGHDYAATARRGAIRDGGRIYTFINEFEFFNNFFGGQEVQAAPGIFSGWVPFDNINTRNVALNSDGIGATVAINGLQIIAGAPTSDFFGVDAGAAYLYTSPFFFGGEFDPERLSVSAPGFPFPGDIAGEGEFQLIDVYGLPTPARNDYFGTDLDISGNYIVIGAPGASHPLRELGPVDSGLGMIFDTNFFFFDR